jgi:hypothetical protein
MNKEEVLFLTKMILDELLELGRTSELSPEEIKYFMIKSIVEGAEKTLDDTSDMNLIAEQADAVVDIWYYSLNAMAKRGINASKVFDIVHSANMKKKDPESGVFNKREDGKIIKPIGWQPPDVLSEIKRQRIDNFNTITNYFPNKMSSQTDTENI